MKIEVYGEVKGIGMVQHIIHEDSHHKARQRFKKVHPKGVVKACALAAGNAAPILLFGKKEYVPAIVAIEKHIQERALESEDV